MVRSKILRKLITILIAWMCPMFSMVPGNAGQPAVISMAERLSAGIVAEQPADAAFTGLPGDTALAGQPGETAIPGLPAITTSVLRISETGNAKLGISSAELDAAGFALGDMVTVRAGSFDGIMPYLNGYYVGTGECLLLAYPGEDSVTAAINYGKFSDAADIAPGDPVSISLEEKAGALTLQEANNLVYTDDINDYGGDEAVFANFRSVEMGSIGPGRLYRSASPIINDHGRSPYADKLAQAAGIRTIMDMADRPEEVDAVLAAEDQDSPDIEQNNAEAHGSPNVEQLDPEKVDAALAAEAPASPYYEQLYRAGGVICLGMPLNYRTDGFGDSIVAGFTFLSENEPPYLVHCKEGKDRTGFAAMLLGMLCGASPDEIGQDYMQTYKNYYGVEKGTEKYDMLMKKNVAEMMRFVCGLEQDAPLDPADLQAAARAYLLQHGMTEEAIDTLVKKLK